MPLGLTRLRPSGFQVGAGFVVYSVKVYAQDPSQTESGPSEREIEFTVAAEFALFSTTPRAFLRELQVAQRLFVGVRK